MSRSRNRLSSKCACIKACIAFYNHAIYRNSLARIYNYYRTNFYVIWIFFSNSSILMHYICNLRTYIHQIRYILTALSNRYTLEKLSYLIEKHYRNSFRVIICFTGKCHCDCSACCYCHQEIFIKNLTVDYSLKCVDKDIVADHNIRYQIQKKPENTRYRDKMQHYHQYR